jgi:hypothetical protein
MTRIFAPVLLALALAAPAAAETRDLSGFHQVSAQDRLTVEVTVGQGYSVEVTGADADRVRARLEGRTLRISDAHRSWFGRSRRLDAHVRVTTPSLEGVAAARGAELTATLAGACDDFSAAATMGGSARVQGARCDSMDASAAMGGELELAGACGSLSVSAAMGGLVRANELACATVNARAAMGGDIRANASQTYDASASMGGSVNVAGGATAGDTASAMGGSITSRD